MPVGWYQTEFVVASSEDAVEETQSFVEFVMVYEAARGKFEKFIQHFLNRMPKGWDREFLPHEWVKPQVDDWVSKFFDRETDDIGNTLDLDLIRIARHIAQKQVKPQFYSFDERSKYDLDVIARNRLHNNPLENDEFLRKEFGRAGNLWKVFYKSFERFGIAFDGSVRRVLHEQRYGSKPPVVPPVTPTPRRKRELSEPEKGQVKKRDGYRCLCCSAKGKGVRLEIDHIIPYNLGGETSVENSQTLCNVCNQNKDLNEMNFIPTTSPLAAERDLELLPRSGIEDVAQSVTRLVNSFYRCRAVYQLHIHKRPTGQFYSNWEIKLYQQFPTVDISLKM